MVIKPSKNILITTKKRFLPLKLYVKKSCLMFLWLENLFFLKFSSLKKKKMKIRNLKTKRNHITFTKAPMAHKTNSKEQFSQKFFFFNLSYSIFLEKNLIKNSFIFGKHFSKIFSQKFFLLETNFLFSRSATLSFPVIDSEFFLK